MLNIPSYRTRFLTPTWLIVTAIFFCGDHADRSGALLENDRSAVSFAGTDKALSDSRVKQFVHNYIQNNKECLIKIKQRCDSPFDLMDSIFNGQHLPVQLKYLAVIESELKTTAVSHVGAAGPWQLMPETAQLLGLKVSRACDERLNYPKSTAAAARYLKDLHVEFGDWLLVLAAYNGGDGPVHSAIRRSKSRNFWILQCYLPRETREYVKRFMATYYYFEGQGNYI
jgi:membrane-bound lytic murein transglycosylase D